MPALDATASTAVSGSFAPVWFIYLNLSGDPLRVTTFKDDVTFGASETGDSDLDGNTFVAWGGQLLDVGDISNSDSGSDTMTITLSGIVSLDTDLLNDIGDKTLWQGRECRIWHLAYDASGETVQGGVCPFYTGYMSSVKLVTEPEQQVIQLSVENWLAAFNQPSNRSYLNQKDYDSADTSAQATIAASNGMRRDGGASPGSGGVPGPGTGGSITGGGFPSSYPSLSGDLGGGGAYGGWGSGGVSTGAINRV